MCKPCIFSRSSNQLSPLDDQKQRERTRSVFFNGSRYREEGKRTVNRKVSYVMIMIETRGLRKSFGDHVVLDGIDLDVARATIFALLGPNGAGKTTMVQILSTLIGADSGEARVAGHDLAREPDAVRAAIGVTGQFSAVDNLLTGKENLLLMADLHHLGRREGRRRAAELLEMFELTDAAGKPAMTSSPRATPSS